jgi:uncharacterized protein YchJ
MSEAKFTQLEIISTVKGEVDDDYGVVHFSADYIDAKGPQNHNERSIFMKVNNKWIYKS